jgi:type II secretory pathway component GspD/PulD (secretin)
MAVGVTLAGAGLCLALVLVGGRSALAQGPAPQVRAAHGALNMAIDCYRRGDYDQAALYFQQARLGQDELSPQEQQELNTCLPLNNRALQARRDGTDRLNRAVAALKAGQPQEAATLLRSVTANLQFLTPADKQRAQRVAEQLRGSPAVTVRSAPTPGADPRIVARTKLQQSRALAARGNFDAAEALGKEAAELPVVYSAGEDTPAKLLDEIHHSRNDPKVLLGFARSALQEGDYDRAERFAHDSELHSSTLSKTFKLWGDSPSKCLKDIQTARARTESGAMAQSPRAPETKPAQDGPRPADSYKNLRPSSPPAPATADDKNSHPSSLPPDGAGAAAKPNPATALANAKTERARQLIQAGRRYLADGDYDHARLMAKQASALNPELHWTEYTPEKLLVDIDHAEGAHKPAVAQAADKKSPTMDADQPTDAHEMLHRARQLYKAGKLDDARQLAQKAGSQPTRWGLFEDTPEKVLDDIQKARVKRDQEESVKVLVEARKQFDGGNLDEAQKLAFRAERLHGPYSYNILELTSDKPQKLLAEIEVARSRKRPAAQAPLPNDLAQKEKSAHEAVAQIEKPHEDKPAVVAVAPPPPVWPKTPEVPATPEDPRAAQARQMLVDARFALIQGDLPRAVSLCNQVDSMGVALNRPGDDSPTAVRRAINEYQAVTRPGTVAAAGAPAQPVPVVGDTAHERAAQLVKEARQFQQQGQLVQAREKAVEAQRLGAAFRPDEDRPEVVLVELSTQCHKQIELLVQQANDYAAASFGDAARGRKADDNLAQARQLAVGFGFDTHPIDERVVVIRQQTSRAMAAAPPATPVPSVGITPVQNTEMAPIPDHVPTTVAQKPVVADPGQALLDKARLELQRGQTSIARQLAEAAYDGKYGVQAEATELLRSIDAEEFNQRMLVANRNFDTGLTAYYRKDYTQAAAIWGTIDAHLLNPDKQSRLKELMMKPEMQPTAVAQVALKGQPITPVPATAGHASVNDLGGTPQVVTPEQSLAQQTRAMEQIQFQKLREQGMQARREATEQFKAGNTDQALEILQSYLTRLRDARLDADQVALLQRPVDARLQELKLLKAHTDWEHLQANREKAIEDGHKKEQLVKENMHLQVEDLMKKYHALMKEGKYKDAEMYAMRAKDLDPDNTMLDAAIFTARMQGRVADANAAKQSREQLTLDTLNGAEKEGPYADIDNPLVINKEAHDRAMRREISTKGILSHLKTVKEREIERRLELPISLDFKDTPLRQVLEDLGVITGINVVTDRPALLEDSISLEQPVTMKLEAVAMKSALTVLLHQVHLTYVISDDVLQVTTEAHAKGRLVARTFPVADLIIPIGNHNLPGSADLMGMMGQQRDPNVRLGTVQPWTSENSLMNGNPVSSPGLAAQPPAAPSSPNSTVTKQGPSQTMEAVLMKLITSAISPSSWSDVGGPGTIDYFPLGMALVINQTPDIQEQVADLLAALRRLQDQEVAVEVRLISLSEAFYERIGIDFNVNIVTDNTKYNQMINSQQFQPFGFVNKFSPSNFITGLQASGSRNANNAAYTSDLNIPVPSSSFERAIPPFGGYPNIPGADGGLSLGLAFLSDVQVFMFMEAAQGDRRMNVMQAPKLTMFNGQTATININDFQFFVTNVTVVQAGGQIIFVPNNVPVPLGIFLTIQPVVSADRRFVRMNINPIMTNLNSALVPLFPITTFITPTFEGGQVGQPIPFTQFIQQPVFTTINVATTVNVPDGGTVVMGGLKLLNEGRNEFGPPVLSKIPYIDRLFKNVGYGRDTSSLLIMVTPRIIINEEEEIRQTGIGAPPGQFGTVAP